MWTPEPSNISLTYTDALRGICRLLLYRIRFFKSNPIPRQIFCRVFYLTVYNCACEAYKSQSNYRSLWKIYSWFLLIIIIHRKITKYIITYHFYQRNILSEVDICIRCMYVLPENKQTGRTKDVYSYVYHMRYEYVQYHIAWLSIIQLKQIYMQRR